MQKLKATQFTLSIKIAQKPYIIGSLGPKALKYESFEGKGSVRVQEGAGFRVLKQYRSLVATCICILSVKPWTKLTDHTP